MHIFAPFISKPRDFRPEKVVKNMIVQPKLNGVRGILHCATGRVFSRHRREFPGLVDWHPPVNSTHHTGCPAWLDGELVADGFTLQSIAGAVQSHEPDALILNKLRFVAFDSIEQTGVSYITRYEWLQHCNVECLPCYQPDGSLAKRCSPITAAAAESIFQGLPASEEGLIYRDPDATYCVGLTWTVLKRKKLITKEYKCLEIREGLGKFAGMFGAAVLDLGNGRTFRCGGGALTVKDRQDLWAKPPIGQMVTVEFPYFSDDGTPLQAQWVAVRNTNE